MKKNLVIYHAPAEAMAQMATATEEDKMKSMEAWMSWKAKSGEAVLDFGAPLKSGQATSEGKDWANSAKGVSGYSFIQGENEEKVQKLFTDHPHLSWHPQASIEVHEVIPM